MVMDKPAEGSSSADSDTKIACAPACEISEWEQLTLDGSVEFERLLRWLGKKCVTISFSEILAEQELSALPAELEYYSCEKFTAAPEDFFQHPASAPAPEFSTPKYIPGGEVVDLQFLSGYTPRYEPFRREFESYQENRTVHARLWRHTDRESLGTMITLHGWKMGDQRSNALIFQPGYLFRLGLDVLVCELPFHGRRAPDHKMNLFPTLSLARTNESIGQAVYDLRSIALWLKNTSAKPIGVYGMSIGAYIAALWDSLDPLSFAITSVPVVSLADTAWTIVQNWHHTRDPEKQQMLHHVSYDDLAAGYRLHSPLLRPSGSSVSAKLIIASTEDPLVPPWQPHRLWQHWGKPEIRWLTGGHVSEIQLEALPHIHTFLRTVGLAINGPAEVR